MQHVCSLFKALFLLMIVFDFAPPLPEKEEERAEEFLGTMDSLLPRATHNSDQVWTATPQALHYSAFYATD